MYTWESERHPYRGGEDRQTNLKPELVDVEGNPIESGLLIAAYNMRAFATDTSSAYLNSKDFNPISILGVWVKG